MQYRERKFEANQPTYRIVPYLLVIKAILYYEVISSFINLNGIKILSHCLCIIFIYIFIFNLFFSLAIIAH